MVSLPNQLPLRTVLSVSPKSGFPTPRATWWTQGPTTGSRCESPRIGSGHLAFGTVLQVWIGMLVSAARRSAFSVMRQPVLVGVDADKVLETGGDSRLLVSFPFRQAEHDVALDGATGNQVFVPSPL